MTWQLVHFGSRCWWRASTTHSVWLDCYRHGPSARRLTVNYLGLRGRQAQFVDDAIHRPTTAHFPHAIATVSGLAGDRMASTDVLIWAGGGSAPPPLPDAALETTWDEMHPLLIIDFDDRPASWLRRATDSRRVAYLDRGWFAPDVDPRTALVERFLAQRPKGDAR